MSTKTQILLYLALLALIDTAIPIPITAMILIMVLFQKPKWFKDWVEDIYRRYCGCLLPESNMRVQDQIPIPNAIKNECRFFINASLLEDIPWRPRVLRAQTPDQ